MMKEKQIRKTIQYVGQYSVEERRNRGMEVSEAHSTSHLRNVADLAVFVADIYNFSRQEKQLAYAAGWLHDAVRSPSEDPAVGDERASAKQAVRILKELSIQGQFPTNDIEWDAIAFAIERHGSTPSWLSTADRSIEMDLKDKLSFALFVADKMEANGVRVIARRSSFVAGDRLRGEKGDWRTFGFKPNKDEAFVVALESMIRLTFINPENVYPHQLRPLVHPLYKAQREFVNGIMRGLHLSLTDVARTLLQTKNTEGKNIIEARHLSAPTATEDLAVLLEKNSGISDKSIGQVTADGARSSLETVQYFSLNYQQDLDKVALDWRPSGKLARKWARAINAYNRGEWLQKQREKYGFTKPFRALFHLQ